MRLPLRMTRGTRQPIRGCGETDLGKPRSGADLHVARRATKPQYADVDSTADAVNECVLQEVGKSESGLGLVLRLLQFLPRASEFEGYACDGSGDYRPRVEHRGNGRKFTKSVGWNGPT